MSVCSPDLKATFQSRPTKPFQHTNRTMRRVLLLYLGKRHLVPCSVALRFFAAKTAEGRSDNTYSRTRESMMMMILGCLGSSICY